MKRFILFFTLFTCLAAPLAHADERAEAEKNIKKVLGDLLPDEPVTRVRATPFDGLYEVLMGPNVVYMSGDGRYIFKGDMLDMQARENLSENERSLARKRIFSAMPSEKYIEFSPVNADHLIYVFTDIDCAYCRRLHQDVPVLNSHGVGIRYLAYPRAGVDSSSFEKMESVWCADDRKKALTDAKSGKQIQPKQCKNPVEEEYLLGQKFGVRGTPAIYTEDGEELSGYVPPEQLIQIVQGP